MKFVLEICPQRSLAFCPENSIEGVGGAVNRHPQAILVEPLLLLGVLQIMEPKMEPKPNRGMNQCTPAQRL